VADRGTRGNAAHDFDRIAPFYDRALTALLFLFGGEKRLRDAIAGLALRALEQKSVIEDPATEERESTTDSASAAANSSPTRGITEAGDRLIRIPPGSTVLEVGCGTGSNLVALASMASKAGVDLRLVGIDASRAMVGQAMAKSALAQARILVGSSTELPLDDASVDCVLSVLFLHELTPDMRTRSLEEIARVLARGGVFLAVDFARPRRFLPSLLYRALRLIETEEALRYCERELRSDVESHGFELVAESPLVLGTLSARTFVKV
jgi:ubiquinone/menaquinone biosynthesis C-methylase UbiE